MSRHAISATIVMVALASSAHAGPNPVSATAAASPSELTAGQSAEVTITVKIADGWHINAADPGLQFLIPTSLSFALPPGVQVTEPRFPPPETRQLKIAGDQPLRLYEGTIRIAATLTATQAVAKGTGVSATLKYQACNDTVCLRPASIELPLDIRFAQMTDAALDRRASAQGLRYRPSAGCIWETSAVYSPGGSTPGRTNAG